MRALLSIILVSFLCSCVSQSKFDNLESELSSTKKNLEISQTIISDLQKKMGETSSTNTSLEVSVEEMRQALDEMKERRRQAEIRVQRFKELTARFKELVDAGKLKVKMLKGRMILELSSDVLFASGSAELSEEGHTTVVQTANLLKELTERHFQIEGHTDNVPIKTARFPSNWELAATRSLTVLKTMLEAGMDKDRISAASFGEVAPISSNDDEDGRRLNRRIQISVLPDLSDLPGFEELNEMVNSGQ